MHADFPQNRKFPQSGMHRKVFEVALSLSLIKWVLLNPQKSVVLHLKY